VPGFNVVGPWPQDAELPSNVVETDRNYRFNVSFGNIKISRSHIKSVTRPSIKIRPFEMHHRSEEISYPGKISYEPMTLTFYSHAGQTLREIKEWFNNKVYDISRSQTLDNSANRADVILEETNGFGEPTYRYTMAGAFIVERSGSIASYEDNNIAELVLVIRYMKLIEEDLDATFPATDPECKTDNPVTPSGVR